MSYAIDVNVLLHATDESSPLAAQAAAFLADRAATREVCCIAWTTVMSYLRLATHAAVFADPLTPQEAMANIEALLRLPQVRLLAEEEGFWEVYRSVTGRLPVRGHLVPDAHLAALLRQHGVNTLYTDNKDFLKFEFLRVRDPFDGTGPTH
jgi:toxin-antitoxin system PIN domain toxin